jgi:uncharacterized protein (DUF3084 family)
MSDEKIDLEAFLDEMVNALNRRLKEHERAIRRLEGELASLKAARQSGMKMDRSVLKVLRGK